MDRVPPTLDMRPDGTFVVPPRRPVVPLSAKLMLAAVLVAAVAASITIAALAIWVVSLLLPVIIIAGAVAWAAYKLRRWQSVRGQPLVRPFGQPGGFGQ